MVGRQPAFLADARHELIDQPHGGQFAGAMIRLIVGRLTAGQSAAHGRELGARTASQNVRHAGPQAVLVVVGQWFQTEKRHGAIPQLGTARAGPPWVPLVHRGEEAGSTAERKRWLSSRSDSTWLNIGAGGPRVDTTGGRSAETRAPVKRETRNGADTPRNQREIPRRERAPAALDPFSASSVGSGAVEETPGLRKRHVQLRNPRVGAHFRGPDRGDGRSQGPAGGPKGLPVGGIGGVVSLRTVL